MSLAYSTLDQVYKIDLAVAEALAGQRQRAIAIAISNCMLLNMAVTVCVQRLFNGSCCVQGQSYLFR
jgi:hypothetical protein